MNKRTGCDCLGVLGWDVFGDPATSRGGRYAGKVRKVVGCVLILYAYGVDLR